MDSASIQKDPHVVDFRRGLTESQEKKIIPVDTISSDLIASAVNAFKSADQASNGNTVELGPPPAACTVYEHADFPGDFQRPWTSGFHHVI